MVKHIICLKLKDFAEGNPKSENARLAKEKLLALEEKIKEMPYFLILIILKTSFRK